jgi:hypothetical protein
MLGMNAWCSDHWGPCQGNDTGGVHTMDDEHSHWAGCLAKFTAVPTIQQRQS